MVQSTEKAHPNSVAKRNQRRQQYIGEMDWFYQYLRKYHNCVHSRNRCLFICWMSPTRMLGCSTARVLPMTTNPRISSTSEGNTVIKQLDRCPKGLDQRVPVCYDSTDHFMMECSRQIHCVGPGCDRKANYSVTSITLCGPRMLWEDQLQCNKCNVVWAQDVVGRPTTV